MRIDNAKDFYSAKIWGVGLSNMLSGSGKVQTENDISTQCQILITTNVEEFEMNLERNEVGIQAQNIKYF